MRIWTEAVTSVIRRHVAATGAPEFTRKAFIDAEIAAIMAETRTVGATPTRTLGRELQELRDAGLVRFASPDVYRWLGEMPDPKPATPSKGVFLLPSPMVRRLAGAHLSVPGGLADGRRADDRPVDRRSADALTRAPLLTIRPASADCPVV